MPFNPTFRCVPPFLLTLLLGLSSLPAQCVQRTSARSVRSADSFAAPDAPSATRSPGPDSTGTLLVRVVGLESSAGIVRIALTDANGYESDKNVREATLPIKNERAHWTVEAVPTGTYAVRLYHDENKNGELDTNVLGVPQEAYGFSNDARGRFGPPDFEAAAVTLDSDSLSLTITAE